MVSARTINMSLKKEIAKLKEELEEKDQTIANNGIEINAYKEKIDEAYQTIAELEEQINDTPTEPYYVR